MSVYGNGEHTWVREELETGVWMSLGLKTPDGVVEVSSRKFFSFVLNERVGYGKPRMITLTEQVTFDKLVVARTPAGAPFDVLHNGAQVAGPNFPVQITPQWNRYG